MTKIWPWLLQYYLLGFNSYNGFSNLIHETTETDENMLKRIYAYAKGIMSN